MSFAHLNVHSDYSVLQGFCQIGNPVARMSDQGKDAPGKLPARARELGLPAVALTDNGNLFGVLEFYKECRKLKIQPILGMTAYMVSDRKRHEPQDGVKSGRRLVLLARDLEGYRNLCFLSSAGYLEGFYSRPRIDREVLARHGRGLVILSGGHGSEIHDYLRVGDETRAREAVEFYQSLVGREHYFIELQRTGIPGLKETEPEAVKLARATGARLVATNDAYYLRQKDEQIHEILRCVGFGNKLNDASHKRFSTNEFYLKSPEEMAALFADLPECIENTLVIAAACRLEFPKVSYHLPAFKPPAGRTMEEVFEEQCLTGLKGRYGEPLPAAVRERYEMEKGVVLRTGFTNYFLIVSDFIAYARSRGIPVGPGRGSAAGSIVAYALGITDIDPLRFGLLFERFLNEARISMPDIDIDFCQERRGEVIDYVVSLYGKENVAMIATFGTMKAKAAVRDVGRVLGVELAQVNRICKMIPEGPKVTLEGALRDNPDLARLKEEDPEARRLLESASEIEGAIRNISTHAAGVVISDRDLREYLPLYQADDGTVSTQFTMTSVEEDCGLLKMDFLGLQNLTVIARAVKLIKATRGIEIEIRKLPLDERAAYELLSRGDTIGVFQFESEGMQALLRRAHPDKFEDIIALLALYRPGPLNSGMDKVFVECKHGRQPIEVPHPSLAEELAETYGVIIYQEQVMRIANKLAGFSLKEADSLRKAMGKKKPEVMAKFKTQFLTGAAERAIPEEAARRIWDLMEKFAEYGFNKSHSAAYACVSYATAYLKARYPEEFMAALMTCDVGDNDKVAFLRAECKRMGLAVLPPHVNESDYDFGVVKGRIRYGLGGAKRLGRPAVEAIAAARAAGGPFKSFHDFLRRVDLTHCGKGAMEALVMCGAFDDLGFSRRAIFEGLTGAMQDALSQRRNEAQGQLMLFAMNDAAGNLPELPEWPERERLAKEKEVLGFYVSSHPLVAAEATLGHFATHAVSELGQLEDNTEVCLGGLVAHCQVKFSKNNRRYIRFQLEDLSGAVDGVYFCPEGEDRSAALIKDDAILFLAGRAGRGMDDKPSLRAFLAVPFAEAEVELVGALGLHLERREAEEPFLKSLGQILQKYRGPIPVSVSLPHESGRRVQMQLGGEFSVAPCRALYAELAALLGPERVEIRRAARVPQPPRRRQGQETYAENS